MLAVFGPMLAAEDTVVVENPYLAFQAFPDSSQDTVASFHHPYRLAVPSVVVALAEASFHLEAFLNSQLWHHSHSHRCLILHFNNQLVD